MSQQDNSHLAYTSSDASRLDYFAAHAPPMPDWWWGGDNKSLKAWSEWAWSYAKAMLKNQPED